MAEPVYLAFIFFVHLQPWTEADLLCSAKHLEVQHGGTGRSLSSCCGGRNVVLRKMFFIIRD